MEVLATSSLVTKLAVVGVILLTLLFVLIKYLLEGKIEELKEIPNHTLKQTSDGIGDIVNQLKLQLRVETYGNQDSYTYLEQIPVLILSNRTIHSYSAYSLAYTFYLLSTAMANRSTMRKLLASGVDLIAIIGSFAGLCLLIAALVLGEARLLLIALVSFYAAVAAVIVAITNHFFLTENALRLLRLLSKTTSEEAARYNSFYNLLSLSHGLLLVQAPVMLIKFLNPLPAFRQPQDI